MALSFSPAAERNRASILAVLEALLPDQASTLEIASGTGQHAEHFAASHPAWRWQPTDATEDGFGSLALRVRGFANVDRPLRLDVLADRWPVEARFDAVFCANMLHIAPWPTCAALMHGAVGHLVPDGVLVIYGPFIVGGEDLASGNADFDADLRRRDPAWGLRQLDDVIAEATRAGLAFERHWRMPANNLMLAFRTRPNAPSQQLSRPSHR